ncbi:MAG: hypothetical protein D6753_16860 [Planctomycetota bacterium]|nr:MAG: hypothetical protein D6753_16860 [Planctomycetota bacterium]
MSTQVSTSIPYPASLPCTVLLVELLLTSSATAQLPKVAPERLGVDRLVLQSGQRLYGFALPSESDGRLRFAVERSWMQTTYPDRYRDLEREERRQAREAIELLRHRVQQWLQQRRGEELLRLHIEALAADLDHPLGEDRPSQFVVLEFDTDQVRQLKTAPPRARHIAGLAFQHELDGATITPTNLLEKRLIAMGVDPSREEVDLSDRVPQVRRESDRQWAARKALIEFEVWKPIEFQGSEGRFFRVDDSAPDLARLLPDMLGGGMSDSLMQLGAELGLPEFAAAARQRSDPPDWWRELAQRAEQEQATGFLVSRLQQRLLSGDVTVDTHFFAREDSGSWFPVVRFTATANARSQPAERIERIKEDPQVARLLQKLASLGIDLSQRIDAALRHGAATEQALSDAKSQFHRFASRHSRSLLAPPVPLPSNGDAQ